MTSQPPYGPQDPASSGFPPAQPGAAQPPQRGQEAEKRSKAGRQIGLAALTVAMVALVLAGFAAVQSWRAVNKGVEAREQLSTPATAPPAAPATTIEPPTEPPASSDPTATEAGSVPALNAQTEYKVKYPDETLRVPGECNESVAIDLDEPRVRVDIGLAELTYYDPCGTQTAYVNLRQGVRGSLAPSASVTPIECGELIRTSPLSDSNQPIRRGQVYCINTSLDEARNSAGTWKMVILEVTAVTQDGVATFKASAWDIPS